ncbi:MAG: creatininase family protein, partial [Oscillospiraceae bacterium]
MFWENLTVDEFASAIKKSDGVCVFPIGCLEKHGNHLPLGTDIFIAREIAKRACLKEDFIIFPFYPLGMVAEVKHKMGTVALSSQLQFEILHGICDEIYRNGIDKIIIGNGHGGNNMFLNYFAQAMLEK